MSTDELSPWLARGFYLFGFALILTAAIDLLTTVSPLRPADLSWRYGFLGLAAGYLQTPALGLIFIGFTAVWNEHVTILRLVALVCLVASLSLVVAMGVFGLDVLAMRELRPPEARAGVLAGGVFQEVKYFIGMLVFAFLGQGGLKTASRMGKRVARRKPGIVSAQPSG